MGLNRWRSKTDGLGSLLKSPPLEGRACDSRNAGPGRTLQRTVVGWALPKEVAKRNVCETFAI